MVHNYLYVYDQKLIQLCIAYQKNWGLTKEINIFLTRRSITVQVGRQIKNKLLVTSKEKLPHCAAAALCVRNSKPKHFINPCYVAFAYVFNDSRGVIRCRWWVCE